MNHTKYIKCGGQPLIRVPSAPEWKGRGTVPFVDNSNKRRNYNHNQGVCQVFLLYVSVYNAQRFEESFYLVIFACGLKSLKWRELAKRVFKL